MDPAVTIVPVWAADILRNEGVTVRDMSTEDLRAGEIGSYSGFSFVETAYVGPANNQQYPKQVSHGPQRKGRGGKIRRW